MFEKMILRVSYRRLKNYMLDTLCYDESQAIKSIERLRRTDPEVLAAFISWFYTDKFPEKPLFGLNVRALSQHRNLDPVVTFLTVDWKAREPGEAARALSAPHDTINTVEISDELEDIMAANGWNIPQKPVIDTEDESDIVAVIRSEKTKTSEKDDVRNDPETE